MDYQAVIDGIAEEVRPLFARGRVAAYIPALAAVPRDRFAMAVLTADGALATTGCAGEPFSIQSISKIFTLTLALRHVGEKLWKRVGREPSGSAFNSLVQLEYEHGIPRNPFINSGAHVVTDSLMQERPYARDTLLAFVRELSGNDAVAFDETVARSEAETGDRNRSLAYFLKAEGNLTGDVDAVLDVYFHQCALAMSCVDLVRAIAFLARGGRGVDGARVVSAGQAKRINALMQTCGTYDAAGEMAFRLGIPAKSGVGGGIVAVVPGKLSIAVWSPALDKTGNSLAGVRALELFTGRTGLTVF
ncbi:MAG: glutaminase [Alphaproteobacteria bacterium]|nr:glutaminase [Alphaproteobacteria bacterium]